MNLNGSAWRHHNPILSNYGGLYKAPRGARLVRPGCVVKSDVNGRNPRSTPLVLLDPIRDAPRGGCRVPAEPSITINNYETRFFENFNRTSTETSPNGNWCFAFRSTRGTLTRLWFLDRNNPFVDSSRSTSFLSFFFFSSTIRCFFFTRKQYLKRVNRDLNRIVLSIIGGDCE